MMMDRETDAECTCSLKKNEMRRLGEPCAWRIGGGRGVPSPRVRSAVVFPAPKGFRSAPVGTGHRWRGGVAAVSIAALRIAGGADSHLRLQPAVAAGPGRFLGLRPGGAGAPQWPLGHGGLGDDGGVFLTLILLTRRPARRFCSAPPLLEGPSQLPAKEGAPALGYPGGVVTPYHRHRGRPSFVPSPVICLEGRAGSQMAHGASRREFHLLPNPRAPQLP